MPKNVDLHQAQELLAGPDLDVVDVREADDYEEGHVPKARNVPLSLLQTNVRAQLPKNRVLFVCARGVRSVKAAQLAEDAGVTEVFSLDGGTLAWEAAGLPLEGVPPKSERKPSAANSEPEAEPEISEPVLDAVVAENLRKLRQARGISLDQLASLTGLSRALLGQLENGRTSPSVSLVWKLARAFDVHFSALLGTADRKDTCVLREAKAKRLVSPDGRFSSRALYDLGEKPPAEFYELHLAAHSREDALPHQPGTRENLIVTSGRLELELPGERLELGVGDAIVFTADVPHSYVNPSSEDCRMYLVMTYAT